MNTSREGGMTFTDRYLRWIYVLAAALLATSAVMWWLQGVWVAAVLFALAAVVQVITATYEHRAYLARHREESTC